MLNRIVLMGRLCADPQLRQTQNGKPVANFTLAVDRDHNREETDFVDIVAWNGTAEFVNKYFVKGQMAVVTGRLQARKYEKDGANRTSYEVIADSVYFGDSKKKGD